MVELEDIPSLKVIVEGHRAFIQEAKRGEGGYWVNGKKVSDEIVREAMRMMNE